jgi:O-antigen/teichoic acid export membrane protein
MDLPARSLNAIATPIISESWKNKDYQNIRQIYQKSSVTLLVAGLLVYLLVLLNINNLTSFLGKDYAEVPIVVLIMGLAKLIDLGTGVNGQIITTSTNWRFDFFTNVLLTLIAFPLNFFLIKSFGIIGAAYSNLIAIFVYNVVRFSFIYKKYGWQPYSFAHIKILITGIVVYLIVKNIPAMPNIYVDSIVRTGLILLLFIPAIRWMNISDEINKMMRFKS